VNVPHFGRATATFTPTGFAPGPGENCFTGQGIVGVQLDSDGSTLRITTVQIVCTPGASAGSPGTQGPSQGEPFQADGTWAVLDGSGIFAGATGGGTATSINGGHIAVSVYKGTVTLP
jgi:hypothetical protein